MSRQGRAAFIARLEQARSSRVITAVMGDRPAMETRIAGDLIPVVARHLREIGKQKRIDLFLYSTGGDVMIGYRIVALIREYCDHFAVLVPFKCQSTATLIALGADEIVMLPEGHLSPVDPSTTGPYNPILQGHLFQPGTPLPFLPVSVEEVVSYVHLAKEVAGIQGEAGLVTVFEKLTNDIRPLALGQVYRARTQIRMLSRKLLQMHMDAADEQRIDGVVSYLTEKLYSHDYLISRKEARTLGLPVVDPTGDVEAALVALMEEYAADLILSGAYSPLDELKGQQNVSVTLERAYVETTSSVDAYTTMRALSLNGTKPEETTVFDGWRRT
jgi:Serine dehydrogenase proteinase